MAIYAIDDGRVRTPDGNLYVSHVITSRSLPYAPFIVISYPLNEHEALEAEGLELSGSYIIQFVSNILNGNGTTDTAFVACSHYKIYEKFTDFLRQEFGDNSVFHLDLRGVKGPMWHQYRESDREARRLKRKLPVAAIEALQNGLHIKGKIVEYVISEVEECEDLLFDSVVMPA